MAVAESKNADGVSARVSVQEFISPQRPVLRFILVRLGGVVLVMVVVTFFGTLLAGLIPGSPAFAIYGSVSTSFAKSWNQEHGLDNSVWTQYWQWLSQVFHGNLGTSWSSSQSVGSLIGQAIPVTAELAVGAMVISLLVAMPAAMIAASRPNGAIDRAVTGLASLGASVPPFVSGVFLVAVLAVSWHWLPSQGFVPMATNLGENLKAVALPVITLVLVVAPLLLRVLRGDLGRILNEDFVSAARSRGLPEWYVMTRYVLRPASASLITVAGLSFGSLLGGTVIVEVFFNIPGLGNLVFNAVNDKDVPVLRGIIMYVALFFVVINIAVDFLYHVIDPRVKIT